MMILWTWATRPRPNPKRKRPSSLFPSTSNSRPRCSRKTEWTRPRAHRTLFTSWADKPMRSRKHSNHLRRSRFCQTTSAYLVGQKERRVEEWPAGRRSVANKCCPIPTKRNSQVSRSHIYHSIEVPKIPAGPLIQPN